MYKRQDKGLICQLTLPPGLRVLGDRNLIAQMLSNLLDNAIKYCVAGDGLALSLAETPDYHLLRVADTGPGLPDEMKTCLLYTSRCV